MPVKRGIGVAMHIQLLARTGSKRVRKMLGFLRAVKVGMVRNWLALVNEVVIFTLYDRRDFSDAGPGQSSSADEVEYQQLHSMEALRLRVPLWTP